MTNGEEADQSGAEIRSELQEVKCEHTIFQQLEVDSFLSNVFSGVFICSRA